MIAIAILLIASFLVALVAFIEYKCVPEINTCDSCVYRFCASNQHPTVCDECKNGCNYKEVDE